ncbi:MAG: Cof-type HAD-IIB family hydrolase [Turicibacter sp.]|nr:Cof-type HAD-IIB family hydrolase [Turicibacter sp.]
MKLIAIDMDGTLFNSNHEITEGNLQAIKDAQAAGHIVMLCSGRPHDALNQFMDSEYGLTLPVAGSNGAITYTEGKTIHSVGMDMNLAAEIFDYLQGGAHPFKLYTNKGVFTIDSFLERAQKDFELLPPDATAGINVERFLEYLRSVGSQFFTQFSEISQQEGMEIFKFFVSTLIPAKKSVIENRLKTFQGLGFTSSHRNNVEIMSDLGHKGTGLAQMAKHYGIPMENTIAIGDNFNDVPMMEAAGLSIAMENAEEEVKALCDVVTKSNDEDGVAFAIREYVLEKN